TAGPLIQRYSALRVAMAGQLLCMSSFIALQAAVPNEILVACARMLIGLGFGLFFPAGMVYAKSKLYGPRTSQLFGIYAAMVTLPVVLGPGLVEAYYAVFGIADLFLVFAIPVCVALAGMATLKRDFAPARVAADRASYVALLFNPALAMPNLGVLAVGLMLGF